MGQDGTIVADYRKYEPADYQLFKKLDPTPDDETLSLEDWRKISSYHYDELYQVKSRKTESVKLLILRHYLAFSTDSVLRVFLREVPKLRILYYFSRKIR